jgi:uncharacterized protein YndB with AHSA1/START domain
MPTVTRTRTVPAPPERVWTVIANPERLVEWWPRVQRVEEADSSAWTTVLGSEKGSRSLRADYTLVASEHPRRHSWRHEVEESPFERVLSSSVTDVELEPAPDGCTAVTIREQIGLRGFSRLGGLQIRRAARKKLDEALDGLDRVLSAVEG